MSIIKEVEKRMSYSIFILLLFSLISSVPQVSAEQFNIEVKIPETYKSISPGSEMWFTVNVINLGNTDRIDVVLNSEIIDESGVVKASKTKTVAMETTASFVNSLTIPEDLPKGNYYVVASITFPDRTVESREQFTVAIDDNKLFRYVFISAGVLMAVLLLVLLIRYNKSNIDRMILRIKIREIIRKRFKK